jgi:hypothetical protein
MARSVQMVTTGGGRALVAARDDPVQPTMYVRRDWDRWRHGAPVVTNGRTHATGEHRTRRAFFAACRCPR